jgi:hypothetical protein
MARAERICFCMAREELFVFSMAQAEAYFTTGTVCKKESYI